MTEDFVAILDTSGWQSAYIANGRTQEGALPFHFEKAKAQGIEGVIHRVGNGRSFDQSFPMAYAATKSAGLAFGAYYYVQPNVLTASEAVAQVVKWLEPFDLDLPVMADLEHYNGNKLDPAAMGAWVDEFLQGIEAATNRQPIIYTGAWWWNSHVSGSFEQYDNIQARYPRYGIVPPSDVDDWDAWIPWTKTPNPAVGLSDFGGWQFTSDLNGVDFGLRADAATTRLDGNIIWPDVWDRWFRTAVTPVPAPGEPSIPSEPLPWPEFNPWAGKFSLWPFNDQKTVLSEGANGDAVAYLQSVIYHKAGGHIAIDGDFGPQTKQRVKDLQDQFDIAIDGVVGWHPTEGTWPIVDFLAGL